MTATPKSSIGPLAIAMDVEFVDRLADPVRAGKARNVSAIIRTALERYDFSDVMFFKPAQVSISVRLPGELRRTLKKVARTKHTSVAQLVRAAVEAYLPLLEAGEVQGSGRGEVAPTAPATRAKKKRTTKKSGRKPPAARKRS